jgi:hypothetical protein
LPFKCRNCQEHGHFQRNCPKKQITGKEDAEGWQKVKRGKNSYNARGKDKRNQEPLKDGQPSQKAQEGPQTNPGPADGTDGDEDPPLGPPEPNSPTKRSSPGKEYISLNSNTDTEIPDEEDGEASSPKGTPEQPKRGRKTEKKRREEQAS